MNTKAVIIAIAVIAVAIAAAALAGLMGPGANNSATPTPSYVDSLTMDSVVFSSNNSATLSLRQAGNATATLTSYKVTDSGGDYYLLTAWSNPTIPPSTIVTANVLIGTSCPSCALSGTAFTFKSGNTYSITLYASDTNQFSFDVSRNQSYQVTLSIGFGTIGHP